MLHLSIPNSLLLNRCLLMGGMLVCLIVPPARAELGDVFFKLNASDAAEDNFGRSVAISGDTAIVGAFRDDDACPGDNGCDSGSAYLFDVKTGEELFKLTASDAAAGDLFALYVAISGDMAIVSARNDDEACPNDPDCNSGAAYVFDVTTGEEKFKLTASDAAAGDRFGRPSINGNTAIVGASGWISRDGAGAAYVFDLTTGEELLKLTASDGAGRSDSPGSGGDNFGASLSISGNIAIVGAPWNDDAGQSSGSAYLFDLTTGEELFKLTASDAEPGDQFFGRSVAISGNTAIVGAFGDDDACPSNPACDSGAAYLFDVTTGEELIKLTASDASITQNGDGFGWSVGISGNTAIVTAPLGSARAFLFDTVTGEELAKFPSTALFGFGGSAAISGNTAIVGQSDRETAWLFDASRNVVPEPADLNLDGFVDGLDLGILLGNFGQNGIPASGGELNDTDPVDGLDLGLLLGAWSPPPLSPAATIPEPATALLLIVGSMSLCALRKA